MPLTVIAGLLVLAIVLPIVGGAQMLFVTAVVLIGVAGLVLLDRRAGGRARPHERETEDLANRPPSRA